MCHLYMRETPREARRQSINVLVHHNFEGALRSASVCNEKRGLDGRTAIVKKGTRQEDTLHDNSDSRGSV